MCFKQIEFASANSIESNVFNLNKRDKFQYYMVLTEKLMQKRNTLFSIIWRISYSNILKPLLYVDLSDSLGFAKFIFLNSLLKNRTKWQTDSLLRMYQYHISFISFTLVIFNVSFCRISLVFIAWIVKNKCWNAIAREECSDELNMIWCNHFTCNASFQFFLFSFLS